MVANSEGCLHLPEVEAEGGRFAPDASSSTGSELKYCSACYASWFSRSARARKLDVMALVRAAGLAPWFKFVGGSA